MGHRRALATLAGVLILFNSSVVLIFGVIYMMGRSVAWEEVWIDGDWFEQRVVYWEWVLASIVMLASFGTGVAGGIASVKATRYTLAMVSALLLLACAVILQADWGIFMDEPYGQIAFVLVLAILPIPLLMMARPGFTAPMAPPGRGPSTHPMDNYGWSTTHGPGGGAAMGRGRRGSP